MGRAAVLALVVALSACAQKPPVILGARMPAGCTKASRSERCFGWMFDRIVMTFAFKAYEDREIAQYVSSIGARLAAANHDRRHWTFRVLDDEEPQAYAAFNATIYITRGALAILRDEAELAAVLAHEMGHTMAGHQRESIDNMFRDVGETELQKWRDLRYARDDEIQADEQAVVFLARAGYDVTAVERMLRALGGFRDDGDEDASDNRHPVWRERVARAAALAAHHRAGERGAERYAAHVAKLVVGEDPRTIAVVGDAIVFARAGVAVSLPVDSKAFVFRGMAIVVMPGEVVGTVQLLDPVLAKANLKNDDSYTEVKLAGTRALSITVMNDNKQVASSTAKSLIAKARPPRAGELAHLHPMQFDATKPRAIWSR